MLWKIVLSCLVLFSGHPGWNLNQVFAVDILEDPVFEEDIPYDQVEDEFIPFLNGPQTREEAAVADRALHGDKFGGDMIFPDNYNASGDGVRDTRFRWPGYPGRGVVPFVIDSSLNNYRNLIYQAMRYYQQHTCIQFVERTNERDFVYLYYGNGCWSIIGRNGGRQDLSLGNGCQYFGLVVHELGHAIGLIHEHQRSDRDNYIWVYLQNVVQGQASNFVLVNPNNELRYTQYDYDSIMHYGNYAFSRAPNQLMTMQAKNGHPLVEPYNKQGFTALDIYQIRQLYRC